MGFFDGYNVAVSGMTAQRTRINVVSANIANAKTTHTENGGPYKKQNVVFEEVLLQESKKVNSNDVEQSGNKNSDMSLKGVAVKSIVEDDANPVMRFEPNHPDANEDGYVSYPDINPVVEMVDLIEAMRSYEANVATFNTHKNIDSSTLDILKA